MPTLKEVRKAVRATIEDTIEDIKVYERVPASVIVPAVLIVPAQADYLIVHGNAGTGWEFDLIVLAPSGDEEVAQDILDDYIDARGTRSIVAALHTSASLGRNDCSASLRRLSSYGSKYSVGGTEYVGASLRLFVIASHT